MPLAVEPAAVIEVCGGEFSPYLDPYRRVELARIVCDTLVLVFPSGRPFEVIVPWSGAKQSISTAEVSKTDTKISTRSSADRVVQRKGKLFRSILRISKNDLLVSVYSHTLSAVSDDPNSRALIFNFYSPAVSQSTEVLVTEPEQVERVGKPVLQVSEGIMRAAVVSAVLAVVDLSCIAIYVVLRQSLSLIQKFLTGLLIFVVDSLQIRRLCRFFAAQIVVDVLDPTLKTLEVDLLGPGKDYVTDYQMVQPELPGSEGRPVGVPGVFFPLDTCGRPLDRRGIMLKNRDKAKPSREFVVSIFTKSSNENPERGLVVKLYDRRSVSHQCCFRSFMMPAGGVTCI